jgi:membrane protease YdiL (CAAX protease family)
VKPAARALAFMFGWYALLTLPFAGPPLFALALQAVVAVVFWSRYVDGGPAGMPCDRRVRYRLRPLGDALPAVARLAAVLAVFDLALMVAYHTLIPPPSRPPTYIDEYVKTHPWGWLPFTFVVVVGAAFVEEFGFRGILQRALERRFGAQRAIGFTALLFAAAHLDGWHLGYLFIAGLVFGYTAYVTRSIWASVLLHATHNTVALAVDAIFPGGEAFERAVVRTAGIWLAPVVAIASGWLVVRMLKRLPRAPAWFSAGRPPRTSPAGVDAHPIA